MAIKVCTGTTSQPFVHVQARLSQPCTITATGLDAPLVTDSTGVVGGTYSISLWAASDLTPTGTYYTITEFLGSTDNTFNVQVPASAGPFAMSSILVGTPTASASPNHVSTLIVDGTSGVAINSSGDVAGRSFTASSNSPYSALLGDGVTPTPSGVVFGKQWDWGGEKYNALGEGLKGDGTNEDMTKVAALLAKGGTTFFPDTPTGYLFPTPAALPIGARVRGTSTWDTSFAIRGTTITGTAGQNIFTFPDTASAFEFNGILLDGLHLIGGQDQLFTNNGGVGTTLRNLIFDQPSHAGIYWKGFVQEWFLEDCLFNQGQYGLYFNNEAGSGSVVLFDKVRGKNVYAVSQTINGKLLIIGTSSTDVEWDNLKIITTQQDGAVIGGTLREWTYINFQTERNGQADAGIAADTTGTGNSGQPVLVVANSGTGYANGDAIVVGGAGLLGVDLITTISSGGGTANLTLATNILATVVAAPVTKRRYSNLVTKSQGGGPAEVTFIETKDVGTPLVRHHIDLIQANRVKFIGGSSNNRPIYDPNFAGTYMESGAMTIRTPALTPSQNATVIGQADGVVYLYTLVNNRSLAAPPIAPRGRRLTVIVIQDGTGGWTFTLNAAWKGITWSDTGNTLNKQSAMAFVSDGTNFRLMSPQTAYV